MSLNELQLAAMRLDAKRKMGCPPTSVWYAEVATLADHVLVLYAEVWRLQEENEGLKAGREACAKQVHEMNNELRALRREAIYGKGPPAGGEGW